MLSYVLIMSMLSTMGAVCFAREARKEVRKTEDVIVQVKSTEKATVLIDMVKAEMEKDDQLREQIEALSKDVKEEGSGICSSVKFWFQNIVGVPYRKAVDFLSNNVLLCEAVESLSDATLTTLKFHVIALPLYTLVGWFAGWETTSNIVVVGSFIGSGVYAYGRSFYKWIKNFTQD